MIFCVMACCCALTVRWHRTEVACRPMMAAVWRMHIQTEVGPDIREYCPALVAAEGCRRSALVGEPSLQKTDVHRKFYMI